MIKLIYRDEDFFAKSFSFLWIKRIYVGRWFNETTMATQLAILCHERGHLRYHHTELKMLCFVFAPFLFRWFCLQTEFAADRYAAEQGQATELLKCFSREYDGGLFHPSHAARRQHLERYEQTRSTHVMG